MANVLIEPHRWPAITTKSRPSSRACINNPGSIDAICALPEASAARTSSVWTVETSRPSSANQPLRDVPSTMTFELRFGNRLATTSVSVSAAP